MSLRLFKKHWMLESALNKKLPAEAVDFWKAHIPKTRADQVVIAYEEGLVVGFFRWENVRKNNRSLWALGTWVSESQRGRGLAFEMWVKALESHKPPFVHVTCVSKSGLALISKVKSQFPEIDWEIARG